MCAYYFNCSTFIERRGVLAFLPHTRASLLCMCVCMCVAIAFITIAFVSWAFEVSSFLCDVYSIQFGEFAMIYRSIHDNYNPMLIHESLIFCVGAFSLFPHHLAC